MQSRLRPTVQNHLKKERNQLVEDLKEFVKRIGSHPCPLAGIHEL